MLLNQVDCIVELLEYYGFEDIRWTHRELRFRRNAEGGMNISIKLGTTFLPEFKFTTDNAAMIAIAGWFHYQNGERTSLDVAPAQMGC